MKKLSDFFTKPETPERPRSMLIYGYPKVGKTAVMAGLPGNKIIMEFDGGGYDYFDFDMKNVGYVQIGKDVDKYLGFLKALEQLKSKPDFLIIDSITHFGDNVLNTLAVREFNKMEGKKFPEDMDLSALPYGKGPLFKKKVLKKQMDILTNFAKTVIFIGHIAEGKTTDFRGIGSVLEVDLEGKLKQTLTTKAEVVGIIHRSDDTTNILAFPSESIISGSRWGGFQDKEYIISKKIDENTIEVYWNEIFPELSDKPSIIKIKGKRN